MKIKEFPSISIITVTYNAETTVEKTIQSVINQTYKNFEYIIIDGNSYDKTLCIIDQYRSYINTIISEKDNGIYDAMNKALNVANGDFVIFLNAGDVFASNNTIEFVSHFINNRNFVYYGSILKIDKSNKLSFYGNKFTLIRLMQENICHQSIFYPKCLYKQSQYNLRYKLLADWEYNIKHFKSFKFQHIPIIISIYDTCGLSSINEDSTFTKERPSIIKRYWGTYYFYLYKLLIVKINVQNKWAKIKKEL